MTPVHARRAGAARLSAAGVESADHDATDLLAHVLGVEPGRLAIIDDLADADRVRYNALIDRRAAREPLQHITGIGHFAGLELCVGPGVFVPRPETELLVEWGLGHLDALRASGTKHIRVADLCSGSGAIALAIATHAPDVQVVAVERSEAALDYLRRNIAGRGFGNRVQVVAADVTDAALMREALAGCQLILSNPPYVPTATKVSPEVLADPHDAVFSGSTGMDVIATMVPIVAAALPADGAFAVEHDDVTAPQVQAELARDGMFTEITSHLDLAGRPRFVTGSRTATGLPTPRGAGARAPEDKRVRMEQ